jgi:hypothetical protein
VLSKGVPGMVGSTTSYVQVVASAECESLQGVKLTAAAMVWDARRETASTGENPASANLAKIVVTSSVGSGTVRSGAAATGGGRPEKYKRLGAPAQLVIPTAAARWTLEGNI